MKVWREATTKPPLGATLNWDAPINRGKVGCWLFNEGAGATVANLVGSVLSGAFAGTSLPKWAHSGCFFAEGDKAYIPIALPAFGGNAPITVVSRAMCTVNSASSYLLGTNAYEMGLGTNGSNVARFLLNSFTTNDRAEIAGGIAIGIMQQYVGIYDGTNLTVYAGLVSATVQPTGTYAALTNWRLGGFNSDYFMAGYIERSEVYSRALSAADVLALYREPYGLDAYLVPGIPVFYSIPAGVSAYGPLIGDGNLIGGGILVGVGGLV
jgi:hypothetical protein